MSDYKISSLNKKSDKYLFKKRLTLRRKSKQRLLSESFFMFALGLFLVYLKILIPEKASLFVNFSTNFQKSFVEIKDLFVHLSQFILVIFIFISFLISIILFLGSFYRIVKVLKRKTKQISYK